jgi:hypothetical protein
MHLIWSGHSFIQYLFHLYNLLMCILCVLYHNVKYTLPEHYRVKGKKKPLKVIVQENPNFISIYYFKQFRDM